MRTGLIRAMTGLNMGLMDRMKETASQAVNDARKGVSKFGVDLTAEMQDLEPAETAGGPTPLYEVESHIDGKNAKVRLWPDRIEWERGRGISGAKITTAVFTMGASAAVTGLRGSKDAFQMVLLEHVTNVSNAKDGLLYHAVNVQTASGGAVNTDSFRVSREEAREFRNAILGAMQALRNPTPRTAPPSPATPPQQTPPDFLTQLEQLGKLRDAGVLTDDEFAKKKAEILDRL